MLSGSPDPCMMCHDPIHGGGICCASTRCLVGAVLRRSIQRGDPDLPTGSTPRAHVPLTTGMDNRSAASHKKRKIISSHPGSGGREFVDPLVGVNRAQRCDCNKWGSYKRGGRRYHRILRDVIGRRRAPTLVSVHRNRSRRRHFGSSPGLPRRRAVPFDPAHRCALSRP